MLRIVFVSQRLWKEGSWQYELFRDELARQARVFFCGYGYETPDDLQDFIDSCGGCDVIVWDGSAIHEHKLPQVRGATLKVFITADYSEEARGTLKQDHCYTTSNIDAFFVRNYCSGERLRSLGISQPVHYMPHCVDTTKFVKLHDEKYIDILCAWTGTERLYPRRAEIKNKIQQVSKWKSVIGKFRFDRYVEHINISRICLNNIEPYNFVNCRVSEVLSCGSFLLTDVCDELALQGYTDNKHLVTYTNLNDMMEKIDYYLENKDAREEIARSGEEFVRTHYSTKRTVSRFIETLKQLLVKEREQSETLVRI